MTTTDDDAFVEHLRERTLRALPTSQLNLDTVLRVSQRKASAFRAAQLSAGLLVATLGIVGVAAATGLGARPGERSLDAAGPRGVQNGTHGQSVEDSPGVTATPTVPGLCAEFPMPETDGPDYEGWWNSTPADADGQVITDPALWPVLMRDHPKTALVDTTTGRVISTWDRVTCGPLLDYDAPAGAAWPTDSVIVLDATTGEVVDIITVTPPVNPTGIPDTMNGYESSGRSAAAMVQVAESGLDAAVLPGGFHLVDQYALEGDAQDVQVYGTVAYERNAADHLQPRGGVIVLRLVPVPAGARDGRPMPPPGITAEAYDAIAVGAVLYTRSEEPDSASLTIPAGDFDIIIAGTDVDTATVLAFAKAVAK